jgi:Mrp family chromosome partitioning ATPase/uncharacterized protein involved in exopolysaccharide biosynthesis
MAPPSQTPHPSDLLEPAVRLARRAVRFWRVSLVTFAAAAAATVVAVALLPKQYRSEAVVYYREGLQWATSEGASPRRVGQRLKDVLLARVQLAKVVEELGLYPELVKAGRTADAVEEMRNATSFKFADGDVFVISFTGRTPAEAQRVTATLTEVLIGQNSKLRSQQAEVAREFLDAEKKRKADELASKEGEQLRFLARHPEFAQEQGGSVGVTLRARTRRSAEGAGPARDDSAIGALRREEQRLRRQLRSPGQLLPATQEPALLQARNDAEAKLSAARRDLADRRARFTEQHPDVRMAKAVVASAEEAYRRAAEALEAAQRPVPQDVLRERLSRVEKDIAAYEREHPQAKDAKADVVESSDAAKRIVAVETEWARLTREVAEARERLQQLDSQQFMASMTASMLTSGQTAQIIVIDPAFLPAHPIGLSLSRKILAGLAAALALAVGVALTLALFEDVIYDAVDLERLGIAPVLTEVPAGSLQLAAGGAAAREGATPPRPGALALAGGRSPAAVVPVQRIARPRMMLAPPSEDAAGGARSGAEPARAVVPPPTPEPPQVGAPSTAIALPAHVAEPSPGANLPATTFFSFESDFSDFVRIHRVPSAAPSDGRLVMLGPPDSPAAASFRVLRHRLYERRGAKTILVTSPDAGEGKTLTAVNLALAMGETGLARVLLLEANFRSPCLARLLDFRPPICLTRQFEIHRALPTEEPWVVVETVAPWLHVAAVSPDTATRPMLDGRALALCIDDLQAGYDYIVIDGPPVLDSADVNLIEECVDGMLVALQARTSRVRSFRKAIDQVGTAKLLGVVLLGT